MCLTTAFLRPWRKGLSHPCARACSSMPCSVSANCMLQAARLILSSSGCGTHMIHATNRDAAAVAGVLRLVCCCVMSSHDLLWCVILCHVTSCHVASCHVMVCSSVTDLYPDRWPPVATVVCTNFDPQSLAPQHTSCLVCLQLWEAAPSFGRQALPAHLK